jgi:hypothetical protein
MTKISTKYLRGLSLFLCEQTINIQHGLHARFVGEFSNIYRRMLRSTLAVRSQHHPAVLKYIAAIALCMATTWSIAQEIPSDEEGFAKVVAERVRRELPSYDIKPTIRLTLDPSFKPRAYGSPHKSNVSVCSKKTDPVPASPQVNTFTADDAGAHGGGKSRRRPQAGGHSRSHAPQRRRPRQGRGQNSPGFRPKAACSP